MGDDEHDPEPSSEACLDGSLLAASFSSFALFNASWKPASSVMQVFRSGVGTMRNLGTAAVRVTALALNPLPPDRPDSVILYGFMVGGGRMRMKPSGF